MLLLFCFLLILFFSLYLIYYKKYSSDDLIYEYSTLDQRYYWVRKNIDKGDAANTLAKIRANIVLLVDYLKENQNNFPENLSYIKDLIRRTRTINIMETPKEEKYTSYTINKGEKIVFCLRSKIIDSIHDMNTLMYVVIHELAHVGCPEFGHTPLFKKIFKFLLQESIKINIYIPVDYRIKPKNYCGMVINEYIL